MYVTTEGQCTRCVMLQDAACAVRVWRGSDATAVDLDTTPSQTARVRMNHHANEYSPPHRLRKTYAARTVYYVSMALFSVPILIST